MTIPWRVVVEQLGTDSYRTRFVVGPQSFVLAHVEHDEEAEAHCKFIRDQFLVALEKLGVKATKPDDPAEDAFWRFDALRKAHYRDVDPTLPGPLSERDAFKRVVRECENEMLARGYDEGKRKSG